MSNYIGNQPGLASRVLWQYTAEAGQTEFTGISDNGLNLNYVGYVVDVFLNGSLVNRFEDYNLVDGNKVVFTAPLDLDDTVVIIGVGTFNVPDAYTRNEIDVFFENVSSVLRGHIFGLRLSNNTTDAANDIDIAAGEAASDDAIPKLITLEALITKRLDAAWSVGSGNGGLDTGSIANTTYHVWLIRRSDTGVVDALFSTSATSPTMPANYDQKRRIGSIIRAGGVIRPFIQTGDRFQLVTVVQDIAQANPGTSAELRTLSVPAGIKVLALLNVNCLGASGVGNGSFYLSDPDVADQAPSATTSPGATSGDFANNASNIAVQAEVMTNTSSQIRSRNIFSNGTVSLYIYTRGWVDTRGKDS